MARELMIFDGFNAPAAGDGNRDWVLVNAPIFGVGTPRSGVACVALTSTMFIGHAASYGTHLQCGWGFRRSGTQVANNDRVFFRVLNGSGAVKIEMRPNGSDSTIRLRVGSTEVDTAAIPPVDTWVYFEVEYFSDASNGFIRVWINNQLVMEFDGDTVGGTGDAARVDFGSTTFSTGEVNYNRVDDVYIDRLTESPAVGTSRRGPCRSLPFLVDADVTTEMDPSAGSDHHDLLDDLPNDGDTTHVESTGLDQTTLCGVDWSALEAGTFYGLRVISTQRLPGGGTTQVRHLLDDGSVTENGPDRIVGGDYSVAGSLWEVDPDGGGAWTKSRIEAQRIGFQSRAG